MIIQTSLTPRQLKKLYENLERKKRRNRYEGRISGDSLGHILNHNFMKPFDLIQEQQDFIFNSIMSLNDECSTDRGTQYPGHTFGKVEEDVTKYKF